MSETLNSYYTQWLSSESVACSFERLKNKSVLITGANGIIGYALARLIAIEPSISLTCLTRHEDWLGLDHLHCNVRNTTRLKDETYDYIFHCATHSQPQKFVADWRGTAEQSVSQLLELLDRTHEQLIFSSTTEIYSGYNGVASENHVGSTRTTHPRAIYIESKKLAEAICFCSSKATVNRIALAAGPYPKSDDTRLLFELIRRAKAENKLQLRGGLKNLRQYQYTGSCAIKMLTTGVIGRDQLYNNAGSDVVTISQLGKLVAKAVGVPYQDPSDEKDLDGAPQNVTIDTSRFAKEFSDLTDLDVSTEELIKYLLSDIT